MSEKLTVGAQKIYEIVETYTKNMKEKFKKASNNPSKYDNVIKNHTKFMNATFEKVIFPISIYIII